MNFKELAEVLGIEEDEYIELVELYVQTGFNDLNKLRAAIKLGDKEKTINAAHSLKGASGNLGLMEFYEAAKEIEMKARDNRLEGINESIEALNEKFGMLSDSIS